MILKRNYEIVQSFSFNTMRIFLLYKNYAGESDYDENFFGLKMAGN